MAILNTKVLAFLLIFFVVAIVLLFSASTEQVKVAGRYEFEKAGSLLWKIESKMTDDEIVKILGLDGFCLIKTERGGIGYKGIQCEYFGNLDSHSLTITTCLDGDRFLEWNSATSATIHVALGED